MVVISSVRINAKARWATRYVKNFRTFLRTNVTQSFRMEDTLFFQTLSKSSHINNFSTSVHSVNRFKKRMACHSKGLKLIHQFSDLWMHFILISVLCNFNLYTISTLHMDIVITQLKYILPLTT